MHYFYYRLNRLILLPVLISAAMISQTVTISSTQTSTWVAPTDPLHIIRYYDPPLSPWGAGNRGVDIHVNPGQKIRAVGTGTVVVAQNIVNRGVISITHSKSLRSTYTHIRPCVTSGEYVVAGQTIGYAESTVLEWGMKTATKTYLDPLQFITGTIQLLPW